MVYLWFAIMIFFGYIALIRLDKLIIIYSDNHDAETFRKDPRLKHLLIAFTICVTSCVMFFVTIIDKSLTAIEAGVFLSITLIGCELIAYHQRRVTKNLTQSQESMFFGDGFRHLLFGIAAISLTIIIALSINPKIKLSDMSLLWIVISSGSVTYQLYHRIIGKTLSKGKIIMSTIIALFSLLLLWIF